MHRFDEPMIPELPDLYPGVTLLEADDLITPLHPHVVDYLPINSGEGFWVGSRGHGRTDTLTDVSPSDPILNRVAGILVSSIYVDCTLLIGFR